MRSYSFAPTRVKTKPRSQLRGIVAGVFYSRWTASLLVMLILAIATGCSAAPGGSTPGGVSPLTGGLAVALVVLVIVYRAAIAFARLVVAIMERLAHVMAGLFTLAIAAGVVGLVALVAIIVTAT